jgi:hypothetical protein
MDRFAAARKIRSRVNQPAGWWGRAKLGLLRAAKLVPQ